MKKSIFVICCFVALAANGAELQTVVYTGLGQLCSVSPIDGNGTCLRLWGEFGSPSWQPKGNLIVVEAGQHDGLKKLELIDSHAKKIGTLQNSVGYYRPTWSPDGRFIYALNYSIGTALGRWDSSGKNFKLISVSGISGNPRFFQMVSFSPSGNRLAILNENFDRIHLVRLTDNGLVAENVISGGLQYIAESGWIDEKRILVIGKQKSGPSSLWELDVDSGISNQVDIPHLSLRDFLVLSPDKKTVIVCATKDGEALSWSLWKFLLGSSVATRLTTGLEDVAPTWRE